MDNILFKHICHYLPYGIEYADENGNLYKTSWVTDKNISISLKKDNSNLDFERIRFGLPNKIKPIFKPLSELKNNVEYKGKFISYYEYLVEEIDRWCDAYDEWWDFQYPNFSEMMSNCPYEIFEKLIELKFDVFNLIPKGIAHNINNFLKNG